MEKSRIAVIGAGAAGLCTARHFLTNPKRYDVTIFEQNDQVGGQWAYTEEIGNEAEGTTVHSSLYANTMSNLPKEVMCFPDFAFDDSLPSFLRHQDILRYLEDYAKHHCIAPHIRFNTRVMCVRPVSCDDTAPDGRVHEEASMKGLPNSHGLKTTALDCLQNDRQESPQSINNRSPSAIAKTFENGHGQSLSPDSSHLSTERSLHCASSPRQWEVSYASVDERNSMSVAASEESGVFDAVFICNGHFTQPFLPSIPGLENFRGQVMHSHDYRHANAYKDKVVVVVGTGASGQDIALDVSPLAKQVLVSADQARWLNSSPLPANIAMRHRISCVDDQGLMVFSDGTKDAVDAVLFCTGYLYQFPFLDQSIGVTVSGPQNAIRPLYKHLIHAHHQTLFFIGLTFYTAPFPLMDRQVQLCQAVLEGRYKLPSSSEMIAWQERDLEERRECQPPMHYAHIMSRRQWSYNRELSEMAGIPGLPPHVQTIYEHVSRQRRCSLATFRRENYRLCDHEPFFEVVPLE